MQAIRFHRSVPRWLLVHSLGTRVPWLATSALSCIKLEETEPPKLPNGEWVRVRPILSGICGSDLAAIACQTSPYFAPFVSTPFVLGHEIVGVIEETGPQTPEAWKKGQRVVLEPALSCAVRGVKPLCASCQQGRYAACVNLLKGALGAGFQTGFCANTGGGWSHGLVAHPAQLHTVPEKLSDTGAVLAEPFACALHAALLAPCDPKASLLLIGCGTIGLLAIAAYRAIGGEGKIRALARYRVQGDMAEHLGADEVYVETDTRRQYRWVLERFGGSLHPSDLGKPVALGGAPVVLDCVGSAQSIDDALRLAAPGGLVLLVGMPGTPGGVDLTPLWHKELRVHGAYAYGWETPPDDLAGIGAVAAGASHKVNLAHMDKRGRVKSMDLALQILAADDADVLSSLVRRKYPLAQFGRALDEAFHAGSRGAFKVVFEIGK
ncbi:MAG: alcohol dehydrogenase [Planctomycetota bacterium]